jgi:hypothetical protein
MNTLYFLISCGICLLGIVLFLIMIFRRIKLKNTSIKHYEDIRNDLTTEEEPEEEKSEGSSWGKIIGGIISLGITFYLFANVLMPTLVTTNTTTWQSSATSLLGTSQIIAVAGFIFIILAVFGINDGKEISNTLKRKRSNKKTKNKNISHYENIRDDLTIKKETTIEEYQEDDNSI